MSCVLDLTFDLAVVTLTFKTLPRPYLRNCMVYELCSWLGTVGMQCHVFLI